MKSDYGKGLYKQLEEAMALIAQLQEEVRALKLENAELKARLGKNSGNSSKPPSSDFFSKPISTREPSGRKSGGQKGHKPHNAELFDNPDEVIEHKSEKCECGGKIEHFKEYRAKQFVDIEITTKVTEHRIFSGQCTCCGKFVKASCDLHDKVTYGEKLKSLVACGVESHENSIFPA